MRKTGNLLPLNVAERRWPFRLAAQASSLRGVGRVYFSHLITTNVSVRLVARDAQRFSFTLKKLQVRQPTLRVPDMDRISIHPDICNGQPVVSGTRITVQTILDFLAAGDSIDDILEEYPHLSRDDVLACIAFSSSLMKHHFFLQEVA